MLMFLDATKFVLLSVFTLLWTICLKIWSKSRRKIAKGSFLVDRRRSKTWLLINKLPVQYKVTERSEAGSYFNRLCKVCIIFPVSVSSNRVKSVSVYNN